jgi:hypothetical protein
LLFLFQGKRGIEKQPFQLPDFIAATGIEKIRQVIWPAFLLIHLLLEVFSPSFLLDGKSYVPVQKSGTVA